MLSCTAQSVDSVATSIQKIEETAIKVLNKIPAFQKFMKENSQIASLFGLPGDYGTPASLAGLQTRASIQAFINLRIASGGSNALAQIQQDLSQTHAETNKLKDKLAEMEEGRDIEEPKFKHGEPRSKILTQRLEHGFTLKVYSR